MFFYPNLYYTEMFLKMFLKKHPQIRKNPICTFLNETKLEIRPDQWNQTIPIPVTIPKFETRSTGQDHRNSQREKTIIYLHTIYWLRILFFLCEFTSKVCTWMVGAQLKLWHFPCLIYNQFSIGILKLNEHTPNIQKRTYHNFNYFLICVE